MAGCSVNSATHLPCRWSFCGWAVVLLCAAGCGGPGNALPSATVAGVVTLDGTPIPQGTIRFIPEDGKTPTAGAAIQEGKYSASIPKGAFRIEISSPKVTGSVKVYDTPDSPMQDVVVEAIPPAYNRSSSLREEISADNRELNFALKQTP